MQKILLVMVAVALVGCSKSKTKACYWCKESIKASALKCKHCGSQNPFEDPISSELAHAVRLELSKHTGVDFLQREEGGEQQFIRELTMSDLEKVTKLVVNDNRPTFYANKDSFEIKPRGAFSLKGLAYLKYLTDLDLRAPIIDMNLRGVGKLEQLTSLKLGYAQFSSKADNKITAAGLKHLAELQQLEHLDLDCSRGLQVTDAGLKHLAKLKQLEWLN